MKIAVTYESGLVFQHFGHTQFFKLYDIEDNKVTGTDILCSNGSGHGLLASLLGDNKVDVLICGGIGGGAKAALADAGIRIIGGVQGLADKAVESFLAGELNYNPDVMCNHHSHEHNCGEHSCTGHNCSDHGCK